MKDEIMRLADKMRQASVTNFQASDEWRDALEAAVEKLVAENEQLQHLYRHNENEWQNRYDALRAELEAAKADAARMREALEKLACLGNGDKHGNSIGNEIAIAALKGIAP